MDEYTIVSQINRSQDQIYDLQTSIEEKRQKIQDLEAFRSKFNSMSAEFDNEISNRRQAISNVQMNAAQCRTLKRYQAKMESVLTGNKKSNIDWSFSEGNTAINTKIEQLEEEIQQDYAKINSIEDNIWNLKDMLNTLEDS
ncbi:MAG: hypothetical protein U0L42_00865 [Methanobrevibacter sp.]|jgi:predicted  nucleic acid-binding Zn-ribbon protein|uniref:hypothetical protein n=1 Tax=Methanobrevibacter sp. TaxID=66852 RepID=UPI002E75B726|nr:hypothetical protein [Methanobrevibacter sp.]MEE0934202.1 hypothetical protein [Methanobrevibacter sp.]